MMKTVSQIISSIQIVHLLNSTFAKVDYSAICSLKVRLPLHFGFLLIDYHTSGFSSLTFFDLCNREQAGAGGKSWKSDRLKNPCPHS